MQGGSVGAGARSAAEGGQPQQLTKDQMKQLMQAQLKGMRVKQAIVQTLVNKITEVTAQAHLISQSFRPQSQAEMHTYLADSLPVLLRSAVVLLEVNLSSLSLQLDSVNNDIPALEKQIDNLEKQIFVPGVGGR